MLRYNQEKEERRMKDIENHLPRYLVLGNIIGRLLVALIRGNYDPSTPRELIQPEPAPLVSSWGYDTSRPNNPEIFCLCLDEVNYDLNRKNNPEIRPRDNLGYSGIAHI